MPTRTLPLRLSSGEAGVTDQVTVEVDGDRLVGPMARVLDDDAPRLTEAGVEPPGAATDRCVQAFAMVHATLDLVRHADVLGAGAGWPGGVALGVRCVDRGLPQNAEYVPGAHLLRLGVGVSAAGETRFAADDPDVVAHETGHALLHALAPDLLYSWHPDCLAIHEAVADLVAALVPLQNPTFQARVLGSLEAVGDSEVLASIAEEFAVASGRPALRSLRNDATLPGVGPAATQVTTVEPHAVSEVLSGAVWTFITEGVTRGIRQERRGDLLPALAHQLRRLLLRAFVYTPPGELTLADVGRLLVGADRVVHGDEHSGQEARLDAVLRVRGILREGDDVTRPEPALPPLPAAGPDEAWIRAVEAVIGRGRCDRTRVQLSTFRHLVNARGKKGNWQTDVLVRLAWPALLPIGPGGQRLEVVRGVTVVADEATRAVRVVIRGGGESPWDDQRREEGIRWLSQRGALQLRDGPLGALPDGLEAALHLR